MGDSMSSLAFAVTVATTAGRPVFDDVPFGLECLRLLREACGQTNVHLHAWCLMPDHACLLLGTPCRELLAAAMSRWKSLCAQARGPRRGGAPFWQRGFAERVIPSPVALGLAARFILEKPVRAGLVGDFREYPLCGPVEGVLAGT